MATTETSLAFGDGFNQSVLENNGGLDNNQFAGQDYDAESSTQHAQFRQYSSTQGRWMSPDPYDGSYDFANPQSLNRYAYALNNPLSLVDPSGLDEEGDDDGDGGGGSGGAGGEDDFLCPDFSDLFTADPASTGGLLQTLGNVMDAIGNGIEDVASAIGTIFGGDPPLGSGSGPGAIGIVPQPAGIPMTLGYQNIANLSQSTHYASISYWPKSAGGFGHIGIGIDKNDTVGYSTLDPRVPWYKRVFSAPTGNVEDDLLAHKNGEVPHFYKHIPISADQAASMQGAIDARSLNRGHYNLIFNNCAQFVESVLLAGGVHGVPHAEVFGPAILAGILWVEH